MFGDLPPSSSSDLLQPVGGLAHDLLPDHVGAGEAHHVDARVRGEVLARGDVAGDDVEHAGRQPGGVGDLAEHERLERRVAATA